MKLLPPRFCWCEGAAVDLVSPRGEAAASKNPDDLGQEPAPGSPTEVKRQAQRQVVDIAGVDPSFGFSQRGKLFVECEGADIR